MDHTIVVGFYGKLPSHGDFLRRRVSDAFVDGWDRWLQESLAASRDALGDTWLDIYVTSPVWRFGCAPGACGPSAVLGLIVPSVDRVGRYFPLTIVAELPYAVDLVAAMAAAEPFLAAAEQLVVTTLELDSIDIDNFDLLVRELADSLEPVGTPPGVVLDASGGSVLGDGGENVRVAVGSPPQLDSVLAQMLSQRLSALYAPMVLWWSEGSSIVEPSCLITRGLPPPDAFAALLDGSWANGPWMSISSRQTEVAPQTDERVSEMTPLRLHSAGASDVGRVRSVNQDAFVERPDAGVWVVADGLGGHSNGEIASRMVCDALADLAPGSGFDDFIDAATERMHHVNDDLIRVAARSPDGMPCGSTVVAVLIRGARLAVLWAGDSRVYRWRHRRLEQLTRDHNLAESELLVGGEDSNVITRAVGGDSTLLLDLYKDDVQPGDRFLLCSDGLTRMVPLHRISEWMDYADIHDGVKGLIAATLDAGAPDNVTALIVEALA